MAKPMKRRKTFVDGFIYGLAAPSLFISGALLDVGSTRLSGIGQTWRDVGQFIRQSADSNRARRDARDRTA